MTGVAQHTSRNAGPLLASDADRLSPALLFALLLCWIVVVLVLLRLTSPHDRRRTSRSSPEPHPSDSWADDGPWLASEHGPPRHAADRRQGWQAADRLHRVPVQIIEPLRASDRASRFGDRIAAAMLDDLARSVLDAGQRHYRRSWGGVLLHGSDGRETADVVAAIATDHGVPMLVVRAHDIVPVDQRPVVAPVFALAATMAPCVLLIEGVDELASPASPLVVSGHARRVEHELTTAISAEDRKSSVLVVASARSRDAVAPTLLQDGCLDRVIAVGAPTARQRALLVRAELLRHRAMFEAGLDEAVRLTEGITQHQIVDAVHEACRAARRRVPTTEPLPVSTIDLRDAVRRPFGEGPLAVGPARERRIRELTERTRDPSTTFGLVLAGDEDNGRAEVARWIAARARRAIAWLDAAELRSVPHEELDRVIVAACGRLPVVVVWERLDALLGGDAVESRRSKGVFAAVEHLARTAGTALIATMRQPALLDPTLVGDGTVEIMWLPAPGFHDRVALLAHELRHVVLVDTTVEELAAGLHGASRAQVVARCRAAIHAAALREGTGGARAVRVLLGDFRPARVRSG